MVTLPDLAHYVRNLDWRSYLRPQHPGDGVFLPWLYRSSSLPRSRLHSSVEAS